MTHVEKPEPPRRRVLLVDDHPLVRMGLASIINQEPDLTVCGEADGEHGALAMAQDFRPDIAVVDWSLQGRDAANLIAAFRRIHPQMPVLVLSMHDEIFYAERALRAGADGYIMKQEAARRIAGAIRCVADGQSYLSPRVARTISSDIRQPRTGAAPSPRPGSQESGTFISIVIPVYNAERTIGPLCESLIRELQPAYRLQVVLVDDDSRDESLAACHRLHGQYPDIVDCIALSRNFGEHNAVMAGLNCAEGDYCLIMDDDLQNPPSEARKLIEEIALGHDVVYVRYATKQHASWRNLGSQLHNWMATRALGKPADLYLSSFKIISRFLQQEIVRYTGPDPYVDAIILRTTRKIGVITARHEPRHHGRSGYTLGKLVSLWGNMFVTFSLYPLRLLGTVGVLMLLTGMAFGLYTLVALLVPAMRDPDSLERLNATNWFFRGLTLLAVGIVGEYVGRIYMHLTRDPQFIVRHIVRHRPRA